MPSSEERARQQKARAASYSIKRTLAVWSPHPYSVLEHTLGREGVWTELSEDTGSMHLWESVDHTLHDVVRVCSLSLVFALQLYLDNLRVLPDSKLRVPHSRSGRDDVIAKRASA